MDGNDGNSNLNRFLATLGMTAICEVEGKSNDGFKGAVVAFSLFPKTATVISSEA
jgi:hypothetical protein